MCNNPDLEFDDLMLIILVLNIIFKFLNKSYKIRFYLIFIFFTDRSFVFTKTFNSNLAKKQLLKTTFQLISLLSLTYIYIIFLFINRV